MVAMSVSSAIQGDARTPPTSPDPKRHRRLGPRAMGALLALGALAPLVVGAILTPSVDGHGTHTQLGMPKCGWVIAFDRPCPTCGMTTAVTHAAHGDLVGAAAAQPAGAVFALLAAMAFWCGVHGAVTGADTVRITGRLFRGRVWWAIGGILLASWAYKMVTFSGS